MSPILTLQPDATDGKDSKLLGGIYTSYNCGVSASLAAGAYSTWNLLARSLIQFDLSSIPASATIIAATLSLYQEAEYSANDRTLRVYRCKRVWVEGTRNEADDAPATGATWVRYNTVDNWAAAGAFDATDCEQTDIGSRAFAADEASGAFKDWTLTPGAGGIQDMITGGTWTNNGFLLKADTENEDLYSFYSSDHGIAAERPKLVVEYTVPGDFGARRLILPDLGHIQMRGA